MGGRDRIDVDGSWFYVVLVDVSLPYSKRCFCLLNLSMFAAEKVFAIHPLVVRCRAQVRSIICIGSCVSSTSIAALYSLLDASVSICKHSY